MKYEGAEIVTSAAAGDSEGPRLDVGVKWWHLAGTQSPACLET